MYPFGRVDLIGHASILASLLVVIADPIRSQLLEVTPRDRRATLLVPAGIAVALAVTMVSYAGFHHLIYHQAEGQLATLLRPEERQAAPAGGGAAPGAFWRSQSHYHGVEGAVRAPSAAATAAMMQAMDEMHRAMNTAQVTGNVERDFVTLMVPHHQSAVDMARVYLESGRDPQLRKLAAGIVASQQHEIEMMKSRGTDAGAHGGH